MELEKSWEEKVILLSSFIGLISRCYKNFLLVVYVAMTRPDPLSAWSCLGTSTWRASCGHVRSQIWRKPNYGSVKILSKIWKSKVRRYKFLCNFSDLMNDVCNHENKCNGWPSCIHSPHAHTPTSSEDNEDK